MNGQKVNFRSSTRDRILGKIRSQLRPNLENLKRFVARRTIKMFACHIRHVL